MSTNETLKKAKRRLKKTDVVSTCARKGCNIQFVHPSTTVQLYHSKRCRLMARSVKGRKLVEKRERV